MSHKQHVPTNQQKPGWQTGGLAGLLGTIPMTIFMFATQRFLPKGQQYALPPEIITSEIAQRFHIQHHLSKPLLMGATLVSHLGYGATMGILYSPFGKKQSLSAGVRGGLFGLFVWIGSYFGLLPLVNMLESGHREPRPRNAMMVVAHLIWGSATGVAAALLKP
jgi:putative membrane protein